MATKAKDNKDNPKYVKNTPEFRVSFPQVYEKKGFNGSKEKYSLVMLFNKKTADLTALKKAAQAAAIERWGSKEKVPKNCRWPWKDGDEKGDMMGYAGTTVINASTQQKPGVFGPKKDESGKFPEITEADGEFYAGCYARASLVAFAYPKEGVKGISPGVSFALQNVQKLRDGEKFSGRKAAEQEFDEVEDDGEDKDAYSETSEEEETEEDDTWM